MRKMLIGSILLVCAAAFGQSQLEYVQPGDLDDSNFEIPNRGSVLFSTFAGIDPPAFAVISQNFTDDGIDFQTFGADDFTVPDCGWEINRIVARGNYSNNLDPMSLGPATSVNVYILPKTGMLPTSTDPASIAVWFATNLPYEELDAINGGDFGINIPNVVLAKGDYWLLVQANMDFLVGGQWNWTESSLTPNSGTTNGDESAWFQTDAIVQNPSTMMATCVDAWGQRVTDCGITRFPDSSPPADRDFAFTVEGAILNAGVTINPTAVNTVEDGSAVMYAIVLDAPPCPGETVTITPTSGDVTEGTVAPGSLMFTDANWDVPQNVTVTPGASLDGNDGDVMYMITHAVSSDDVSGCYQGVLAGAVSATNTNIDGVATITIDPSSGLVVSEDGGLTANFTVTAVGGPPTMDVTVPLVNNDPGEIMLSTTSVVLNGVNSYSAMVTVTGIDNDVVDGTRPWSVTAGASSSGDAMFNGVTPSPATVTGTITDDDVAGVSVMPSASPLATSETDVAPSASVDYVLDSEPTADVTFNVSIDDGTEASVTPTSLTFTSANWDTPQTVDVMGLDDDIDDGTQSFNVVATPTNSADPNYVGVNVASAPGNNADDTDTAGFTVNPTSGLMTSETGTTDTFTVVLDSEPVFGVSIDVRSDDITEGLVSDDGITFMETVTLNFNNTNWDTPQTVTVEGQDDNLRADGDIVYDIVTENVVSGDAPYAAITDAMVPDVEVTNMDEGDIVGVTVTPTSLILQEDGPSMDYTVQLDTEPIGGNVTIPVTSGDTSEATVSPASLVFTAANWNVPQVVTVTPVEDFLVDADQNFDITNGPASGANYGGQTELVDVTVENVDVCGPMTLDVEIGFPIIAYGTPGCVFDLFDTNGSNDPNDWTYLGTFTVGPDGSVDTGVIAGRDALYVTAVAGSNGTVVLTPIPYATVPTLGEWGLIGLISLLAIAALLVMRRRTANA